MQLSALYTALAGALDEALDIEAFGKQMLLNAAPNARFDGRGSPLRPGFMEVLKAQGAHPVCKLVLEADLPWAPPETSSDPAYIAHSSGKSHVELIGPEGLVRSGDIRLGLYGILRDCEYGLRTHPAEEVFVMLAGEAEWKRGAEPYQMHGPGERSFHPSMLPHATRTQEKAFMSIYIWRGDVSTENYVYEGLPVPDQATNTS